MGELVECRRPRAPPYSLVRRAGQGTFSSERAAPAGLVEGSGPCSGDHARVLPAGDVFPRAAELLQHLLRGGAGLLSGPADGGWRAAELDGARAQAHAAGVEQVAVGLHLRVVGQLERRLQRAPDAARGAQPRRPLLTRPGGEVSRELLADRVALLGCGVGEALEQVR